MTTPTNSPTLDQLAEQAADEFERCSSNKIDARAVLPFIRQVIENATQAQREQFEAARASMSQSIDDWRHHAEKALGALDEANGSIARHGAARQEAEQQLEEALIEIERLKFIAKEWEESAHNAALRILEIRQRHEQQLSQVTQERDERFTETEVRRLMLKAAADWLAQVEEPWLDLTVERVVDRLLAEHKAQHACATPTNSSPPARDPAAPSPAGDAPRTRP